MSDTTLADVLASLQKRLRAVEDERSKLKKAIEAVGALVEPAMQQINLLDSDEEPGWSALPTYAEAAESVLKGMGRSLHIRPILAAMQKRWFADKDPEDRNFSNAVYAAMDRRDDVFVKTGPATFGLAAWVKNNGTAPAEAEAAQSSNQGGE